MSVPVNKLLKILLAEDDITSAILLKRILTKAGYTVIVANNGVEAYSHLERENFDVLLTDWMMPQMDGIELIRRIRSNFKDVPVIIMITALVSESARNYALESGADDYIAKPIDVDEILTRIKDGIERKCQEFPTAKTPVVGKDLSIIPPFVGVGIVTSTGGPPALIEIFKNIPENTNAAFYVIQHGPSWMIETFANRLQKESKLSVSIASHNIPSEVRNVYLAPSDKHLRIDPKTFNIILDDGPKENFVRPAGDPLFRSLANSFGKYSIGVILTGLGRDGAQGAMQINAVNGTVLVQDPESAVAPSMPKTVIETGINARIVPLSEMSKAIAETVFPLCAQLKKIHQNN